nr:uncharacterized protein LOC111421003 [Onthophagus taurus]
MKVWILLAYGLVQLLIGSSNATPVGTFENDRVMTVIATNMDNEMEEKVETVITKVYEENPVGDYVELIRTAIAKKLSDMTWIVIEEPKAQSLGNVPKYLYIKRAAPGYEPAIYLIVGF